MKKFVSILFVVLVALIMLCACEPTVGDDGGNEDRRVIELTFEIETLEAQVNEADSSSNLDVLKEWAEACQLKIDTLKIEGKFEGLDALENRVEEAKRLIEAKRYPKTIISDDEIVELLTWLDENKTWEVYYDMADMEAHRQGPEFIHRGDNDVATFKEERSTNNATYRWMNKDKTIVEAMMYNGRGRTYSYRCVNIPEVVEECEKLAEASVKAEYAENWRDYPVSFYLCEELADAVGDMGGKDTLNIALFNLNGQTFNTNSTMAHSLVINTIEDEDFFDSRLYDGFTFTRTSDDVIELKSSAEGVWYYIYTENGYSEVITLIEEKGGLLTT